MINDLLKLGSNLKDLLVEIYQAKPADKFKDHYATIAQIIQKQKKIALETKMPDPWTAEKLYNFICERIENIVYSLRLQLKENIIRE